MSDYLTMAELENKTLKEIYTYAREFKIPYYSQMNKKELSLAVIRAQAEKQGFFYMEGILDITHQDGYGFLRPINYGPSAEDIYISSSQIRRFGLRIGDKVAGKARPPKESERYYGLMHVESVNGKDPEEAKQRPYFPALTPLYPNKQIQLSTKGNMLTTRMIDMFAPVGFGQRGLIVAPPKAGKTTILKEIADLERSVKGDVVYSTFDLQPSNHTRVSELVLERAMRLVEDKRDVVILMDSITRLARAYNLVVPPSGRTLSGGIDPAALYKPKKFFGAARNIEEGGSLTILATALVDTGSRMDDVIYEEFKGTGNMELQLSRQLAERRIFPAIDMKKSGTRKEDLLMSEEQLEETWRLRKNMVGDSLDYTEQFIQILRKTKNNEEFIQAFQDITFENEEKTIRPNRRYIKKN